MMGTVSFVIQAQSTHVCAMHVNEIQPFAGPELTLRPDVVQYRTCQEVGNPNATALLSRPPHSHAPVRSSETCAEMRAGDRFDIDLRINGHWTPTIIHITRLIADSD